MPPQPRRGAVPPAHPPTRRGSWRRWPGCPSGCPTPRTSAALRVMRARVLLHARPPNTRWVWQSTKPGATTLPAASSTRAWADVHLRRHIRLAADGQDALAGNRNRAIRMRPINRGRGDRRSRRRQVSDRAAADEESAWGSGVLESARSLFSGVRRRPVRRRRLRDRRSRRASTRAAP